MGRKLWRFLPGRGVRGSMIDEERDSKLVRPDSTDYNVRFLQILILKVALPGLPILHAGGNTRERLLAASLAPASRRGLARPLHRSRSRRRIACARYLAGILQSRICRLLFVGSARAQLGCDS